MTNTDNKFFHHEKWWNFTLIGVIVFVVLHSVVFFWHQFLVYRYDALYERAVQEGSLIEMPADFQKAHATSRERSILTRPDILIRESSVIQSGIRSVVDQYRGNIYRIHESIMTDIAAMQSLTKESESYVFPERADIIHQTNVLQTEAASGKYTLLSQIQKFAAESHAQRADAEKLFEATKKKMVLQDIDGLSHELDFLDSLYRFTGKKGFDYKTFSKAYKTTFTPDVLDTKNSDDLKTLMNDFDTRLSPICLDAQKIRAEYREKRAKIVAQEKTKWTDSVPPDAPFGDVFSQISISLKYQRMYVYEDGELILSTPITSGRTDHETIK